MDRTAGPQVEVAEVQRLVTCACDQQLHAVYSGLEIYTINECIRLNVRLYKELFSSFIIC